jgi:carbamoyl-phosphate synthase large subunit
MKVLVAGLAGASLGTEIVKSLSRAGGYEIFGCDISPLAYGLYVDLLTKTFLADKDDYIQSIINICKENGISIVVPGGEQPMVILSKGDATLKENGITIACNTAEVVNLFSDKKQTFDFLGKHHFPIPKTISIQQGDFSRIEEMSFPCIVKPSSGTGGSDSVFLATSKEECILYAELLQRNNRPVLIQEYIDLEEGEFTIGVLSDLQGKIISSVAMQRVFNSKLSVAYRGKKGLISSGYSQGLIADFPEYRKQAEAIAMAAGSKGPFNVQGRVKNGVLIPFEINPRFSASTYLRALAGINELDLYLQNLMGSDIQYQHEIKEGYYMRSFQEIFIGKDTLL